MAVETECTLTQEEKDQYIGLIKTQATWQLEIQLNNAIRDRRCMIKSRSGDAETLRCLEWIIEALYTEINRRNGI